MKQIPNIFTLLNLVAGVIAIIFALQTDAVFLSQNEDLITSFNIPEKLTWASVCILIAAGIDFLDGFVARLLNATSELGKQLDSLSDVVSFGVAPSVIMYQLLRMSYATQPDGLYISIVYLLPAVLLACAGAYRLGRFNIATDQQYSFRGVPIPAAGLFVASLPLILHFSNNSALNQFIINKWVLYGVVLVLSYLMISNLRMIALKFSGKVGKEGKWLIALAVIAIVSAVFLQWLAIPVVFIFYVIFSILNSKSNHQ
ncbi:MAG: CDP-alcohol phosphatidyltransferase family protein [Chitinophagaceae bacterium]|nr:CDP-alcohol phosphatidyltransferase family protein [Chitinophagaceae bacterium]MCW5913143.1 CDP-alcohol phosphatidyltransferase family protein [Chitinophagaceae bacterium]MCZ2396942.1 CDP-alcohol phosphatidyltransferase family protein [Chitinophagales bacterium]